MKYTICKAFSFDAAHSLPLGPYHKCSRLHGHTYTVEVVLSRDTLDERGMVVDFFELGRAKEYVDQALDHRNINEVVPVSTAENIAAHLWEKFVRWFPDLERVRVYETASCWAEVTR